ncbi:hypothetical protein RI367_001579 [Sorochytrium milnesiophthora]
MSAAITLRVAAPTLNVTKSAAYKPSDSLWSVKLDMTNKVLEAAKGKVDFYNWGLIEPKAIKKSARFLDECRDLASYEFGADVALEYRPKYRVSDITDKEYNKINTKKTQKKFLEAVELKQYDKVKEELDKGFDPNFTSDSGQTPLVQAVLSDDKLLISALMDNGALVDYRAPDSKTPLHIAAANNKPTSLQTLLYYGAWPDCLDSANLPPLYYAATNGHSECLHKLCQAKAHLNMTDSGGKTALHQACLGKFLPCVALLIDYGADLNAQNATGNTALHICASANALECLQKLLIRGANKDIVNKAGQTPLQFAIVMQSFDIVKFIQKFTPDQIIPPPPPMDSLYTSFRPDDQKKAASAKVRLTSSGSTSSVNMLANAPTQAQLNALPPPPTDQRPGAAADPNMGYITAGMPPAPAFSPGGTFHPGLPPPPSMFSSAPPPPLMTNGAEFALPPPPPPGMFDMSSFQPPPPPPAMSFDAPTMFPPPPPASTEPYAFASNAGGFALPPPPPPISNMSLPPPPPSIMTSSSSSSTANHAASQGPDPTPFFAPPPPPMTNSSSIATSGSTINFNQLTRDPSFAPPPPFGVQDAAAPVMSLPRGPAPLPPPIAINTSSSMATPPSLPTPIEAKPAATLTPSTISALCAAMAPEARDLLQGLVIENKKMQQEIARLKFKLSEVGVREY